MSQAFCDPLLALRTSSSYCPPRGSPRPLSLFSSYYLWADFPPECKVLGVKDCPRTAGFGHFDQELECLVCLSDGSWYLARLPCCNLFSFHPGNSAFKSPDAFKVSLPLRTNYLYGKIKKTLPELYAFTICLWLRSSASPGIGTPFSYAVPGQANEIVLIEWGNNPIELLINDKVRPAGASSWGPGEQTLEEVSTCWLFIAHRADPGQPQSVSATDWKCGGCPPQHGGGATSSPDGDGGGRGYPSSESGQQQVVEDPHVTGVEGVGRQDRTPHAEALLKCGSP